MQTIHGKAWWILLRLYGPLDPWFKKAWRPDDIEIVDWFSRWSVAGRRKKKSNRESPQYQRFNESFRQGETAVYSIRFAGGTPSPQGESPPFGAAHKKEKL